MTDCDAQHGDGLEQYTEPDSSDRPGDAIESGMRETVAHPGIDGTWHHYGNIEWWEPDQLYDSDYARPICPVKHCASGRDHECRTICTRINPDEQLKPEFVETDNPVSGGWFCTHHGWFRIHNYPRETESESEQATLLADGGRVQDTEGTSQMCFSCGEELDLNADEWWAHSWEEHPAEEKIEESLEHDEFRDWFHENKIFCSDCHKEFVAEVLNKRAVNDVDEKEDAEADV